MHVLEYIYLVFISTPLPHSVEECRGVMSSYLIGYICYLNLYYESGQSNRCVYLWTYLIKVCDDKLGAVHTS